MLPAVTHIAVIIFVAAVVVITIIAPIFFISFFGRGVFALLLIVLHAIIAIYILFWL